MIEKILSSFPEEMSRETLPGLILRLTEQQNNAWPQFSSALDALDHVRIREVEYDGCSVLLQYNPARIVSTKAVIDQKTIAQRPCFLCTNNLPATQKGILYRRTFLILCNPYPIVKWHCTLAYVHHIPQAFQAHISLFLKLAEDLSPDFNVFYNGPRAGASAPDHLHFQAAPAGSFPVEQILRANDTRQLIKVQNGTSLFTMDIPGRQVIVIEGKDMESVAAALMTVIERFKTVISTSEEPIMNLLASYRDPAWQIAMFLRRKHRPDAYYFEGEERILVSPGLVEMSGLVITPVEKDFITLDAGMIENLYEEVSIDPETFHQVVGAL
jgi:hypothetical protein